MDGIDSACRGIEEGETATSGDGDTEKSEEGRGKAQTTKRIPET